MNRYEIPKRIKPNYQLSESIKLQMVKICLGFLGTGEYFNLFAFRHNLYSRFVTEIYIDFTSHSTSINSFRVLKNNDWRSSIEVHVRKRWSSHYRV
ncbi:hypothetical protein AQUCO_01300122v1 [Aquilegia coerulea]|uniref:Uncharacterized protein n=1 Tax=Aquilegia coerulea TaxID=218851 RepID=A0A2G5DZX0_AQUCA|nr:hypothetical protein AQUCO_01300122v1 [Aquilegia coerulea]